MPDRNSFFPHQAVLNGADYFLLQLDRIMLRSSGKRNVCTFVVVLQERLEHDVLERALSANPAYRWVTRLRLHNGLPFTLVKWVVDDDAALPEIKQYPFADNDNVPQALLATALDVNNQAPFKIDLLPSSGGGSQLIFTWHHALMDARGGELFIRYLGRADGSNAPLWKPTESPNLPLKERAEIARQMKQFLYDTSTLPLLSLFRKKSAKPTLRYRQLSFTQQQSHIINQRARQQGAGFLVSAFFLAATACAVAHIQQQRAPLNGDLLVPVPLDRRLRGADGPIIGNQVSFLFYRIPQAALSDVKRCTGELIEQMKSLMRSHNPDHYWIMMDLLRRIPGPLYRSMLKSPTAGLMASFFYSDTGDSMDDFDQLFGLPVNSAVHYPPNISPPGMTFVFSRFRGALQITFGYMEQVIDAEEVEQLCSHLHFTLTGETVDPMP